MADARRSGFPLLATTYISACAMGIVAATLMYFLG